MASVKTNDIWLFFVLALCLTWLCWISAGFLSVDQNGTLVRVLHYAGGVMPAIVTLLLLYCRTGPEERRDYWQRLIDVRRIGKPWYIVILLTVPILTGIGIAFDLILGGKGLELGALSNFIHNPLLLIPFTLFILVFGPLPEEMAWRGYALDNLQEKFNALAASLILGLVWTLWHLPLFWIEGTYQHALGVGTIQFWLYLLDKIPQSIIMTWIFNHNHKSTATAVLFHFMINLIGELFNLSIRAEVIYIVSWWVSALLVVAMWGSQREKQKKPVK